MVKQRAKISQDFFSPTTSTTSTTSTQSPNPPTQEEEMIAPPEKITLKRQNIKTSKSQNNPADKQQVTVYLNPSTLEELTIAQLKLKRLTGKRGHNISNSAIVEAALQLIFQDLKENGAASLIAQHMQEE